MLYLTILRNQQKKKIETKGVQLAQNKAGKKQQKTKYKENKGTTNSKMIEVNQNIQNISSDASGLSSSVNRQIVRLHKKTKPNHTQSEGVTS